MYVDVFLEDLLRLPPSRELDFITDLILRNYHISNASYRMVPVKLVELKKQLLELLEKGFIKPSVSLRVHLFYS